MEKIITFLKPTHHVFMHVYLMVSYDGLVYNDYGASYLQLAEANFVVARDKNGELFVWKDRFLPQEAFDKKIVTHSWTGRRAAKHLGWIADSQKEEASRNALQSYED